MDVEYPPNSTWPSSMTTTATIPPTSPPSLSSRRRSSAAAHGRPSAPPPSMPIPSVPEEEGNADQFLIPSRPNASPNLAAVAAFRMQQQQQQQLVPALSVPAPPQQDDLNDPPPPSMLSNRHSSRESRAPSSRRALTRALELAREAVQLDSTNDHPEEAVVAYGRSVALLSEVMERVRRGESSEVPRRKPGVKRSPAAQEEEIRRLQNIHDTYADRMNILSIAYSIPAVPYNSQNTQALFETPSPTTSSPTEAPTEVPTDDRDAASVAIGAAMFVPHPYAVAVPQSEVRAQRRSRGISAAALPPALPPPLNSLPPAPDSTSRPRGESSSSTSSKRLAALEEEEGTHLLQYDRATLVPADSPHSPNTPRNIEQGPPSPSHSKHPPPSPRQSSSQIITPRPRGSSTQLRAEQPMQPQVQIINTSVNQGTIMQRRTKTSAPPTPRSSSPADSTHSASSMAARPTGRSRSSSQPGRRPSLNSSNGRSSPPPLPNSAGVVASGNGLGQRKSSIPSKLAPTHLTVQTDLQPPSILSYASGPPSFGGGAALPTTPISPLPPQPPNDPMRKPYHLMNLLRTTMSSTTGGYITRRLHVPHEVWSQGGAKLANLIEKIRVVGILCSALEDLQTSSSEYFGAGNVSIGLGLGIGSLGRKEGEAWLAKLEDFSSVCDGVVANFGKKLGVGEGFVVKKTTWGDKLGRRFDKFTNGKNLDSPAAYVQGLRKLFSHAQLLDEHTKAVSIVPVAPAYASFTADIRIATEMKLKRSSEFFASVVLTFVIRDLSQLLDKYAKKCEKWMAE